MKLQNWARAAEIAGNFAVVFTVIVLVLEVRENTEAIERQARLERVARIYDPYLSTSAIPEIYARIKAVDGLDEPLVAAIGDRYDMSIENSVRWVRHLYSIWAGLEADYLHHGPSPHLENQIRDLLDFPDQQLFWEHGEGYVGSQFAGYVDRLVGD